MYILLKIYITYMIERIFSFLFKSTIIKQATFWLIHFVAYLQLFLSVSCQLWHNQHWYPNYNTHADLEGKPKKKLFNKPF